MIISSPANSRIRIIRHQHQKGWPDGQGRVLIEGIKLIGEAIKSNLKFDSIYVNEAIRNERLIQDLLESTIMSQPEVVELSEKIFNSISSTESPQGVLALVVAPKWNIEDILPKDSLIVCADQLQDPGNLGTLLRSSEAFGVAAVILSKNSVNPYNSKAIRASSGSVFRVPCFPDSNLRETLELFRKNGYRVYATLPEKGTNFRDVDFRGRVVLVLGNEAKGLGTGILDHADIQVTIPLSFSVESLNVAVACSIILCHAAHQRKRL